MSDFALGMAELLQNAKSMSTGYCCISGDDLEAGLLHTALMEDNEKRPKGRHYLREWREFRGMTQEQLAAAVKPETKPSVISLLETGSRGLSNKWLERLAPALRTKKGFILDINPYEQDNAVLEVWADIPAENKSLAKDILETFRRKAS